MSILTHGMPLQLYMSTELYIKKEDSSLLKEKMIKNQDEILRLLEAVWGSKEVAFTHCKDHQKGDDTVTKGNHSADAADRQAAWGQQPGPRSASCPQIFSRGKKMDKGGRRNQN